MNSWKLNSISSHVVMNMISKSLAIPYTDVYKTVKSIDCDGKITLHNGRKFIPVLLEINE